MNITSHAIEQFIKRYRPDLHGYMANRELTKLLENAAPLKEKTFNGDEWKTPDGMRLVVKRDGDKSEPVVITVLPKQEGCSEQVEDDGIVSLLEDQLLDLKVKLGFEKDRLKEANQIYNSTFKQAKELEDQLEVLKYK